MNSLLVIYSVDIPSYSNVLSERSPFHRAPGLRRARLPRRDLPCRGGVYQEQRQQQPGDARDAALGDETPSYIHYIYM